VTHEPRFLFAGDSAVVVEFGDAIDPGTNARVLALDAAVNAARFAGVVETVPTYRSLLIQIDPLTVNFERFKSDVMRLATAASDQVAPGRRWSVPVVYGGEFGIDLDETAARHKMTPAKLIEIHASAVYRVYAIGFMPGFTYLGGLDARIHTPRRMDPRMMTPSGTISIGGIQALVAGAAMPSGWHLLGRTPVRTFDATRAEPVLFQPGDEVIFQPIDAGRWDALDRRAAAGDRLRPKRIASGSRPLWLAEVRPWPGRCHG
jgi:KipI family sensor histidine kinase inhibitor